MNNEVNDKTYIKLTPFKGWVLENFPFIESDFDCITNYQLLCKIDEYLNNVISNQNQVQKLGTELVNAYNQLLNYVNNYFDNLDVQEEINNKLDAMAEDGSLTNLIKDYVDPIQEEFEDSINNRIIVMENKVNAATSGSPLVASSTSGMTDTTRVYVNTTDGYWYYYNGTAWVQGGIYQSSEDSISVNWLNSEMNFLNPINLWTKDLVKKNLNSSNQWVDSNNDYSITSCQYSTEDFVIEVLDDNLRVIVQLWTDSTQTEAPSFISPPLRSHYVPKNVYYTVTFRKTGITLNDLYGKVRTSKYRLYDILDLNNEYYKNNYKCPFNLYGYARYIGWWGSSGQWSTGTSSMVIPTYFSKQTIVKTKSPYQFAILFSNNGDIIRSREQITLDTGFVTSYTIPANSYATFILRRPNDSTPVEFNQLINYYVEETTSDDIINYVNSNFINNDEKITIYEDSEELDLKSYDFTGNFKFYATDSESRGSQGFAIYDNYLVQLYSNYNYIEIYNLTTGTLVSAIDSTNLNVGHGDCVQFSNTKYDESDLFPLMYVTTEKSPNEVSVIRISDINTATLIKNYVFPAASLIGYYTGHVCDFTNGYLYMIGYKENSYRVGTNNYMIITKWNMMNETLISDNNYSLEKLDEWTTPFIYCCQGQKFLNGKIVIISSYSPSEQTTQIVLIDPIKKAIVRRYKKLENAFLYQECEDCDFKLDPENNKYIFYLGSKVGYYSMN